MLDILRRNRKSLMTVLLAVFLTILMAGFGIDMYQNSGRASHDAVIRVNDVEITAFQFQRKVRQIESIMRQQYGQSFDQLRRFINFGQQAVDALIVETLLTSLVDRLGLSASPRLIRERVETYPLFRMNGLTEANYAMFLQAQGYTAEAFEEITRKEAAAEQLQRTLVDLTVPSERELRGAYIADHTKVELSYVAFSGPELESKVAVDDEAKLKSFYDDLAERYRRPKAVKFAWARAADDAFLDEVDVTPADVAAAYEERGAKFIDPAAVKLQQIVLLKQAAKQGGALEEMLLGENDEPKAESAASVDEEQKKRARQVLDRLNAGEDFGAIAKDVSEDTTSKDQGGELGWIPLQSLDAETRRSVAGLKPGQTTDVVETDLAFKVVKLLEERPDRQKTLDEVKDEIELQLRRELAPEYARAELEKVLDEWRNGNAAKQSLEELAKQNNLQAQATPEFVDAANPPAEIPAGLIQRVLPLGQGEKELISTETGDFLVHVIDVRESSVPPFEEIKDAVIKDYRAAEAKLLAKKEAQALLESIRPPKDGGPRKSLAEAAKERGLTVKQTPPTTQAAPSNDPLFAIPEAQRIAFTLTTGNPVPKTVIEGGDTFYTVELATRVPPPADEVATKAREMRSSEQARHMRRVATALRQALKATADIWVDPKLLDEVGQNRDV